MPFRILFYFFVASVGFEIQSVILIDLYRNNMPGLHLFTIIEFLALSFAFARFFRTKRNLARLITVNAVVFLVIAVTDASLLHDMWSVNTLARSYSSVSILSYTLVYFYFMFRLDERTFTIEHPMFWVSIGTLVYFGSNALYFMLNERLMKSGATASFIGLGAHAVFNVIANYLYAQSFRCFNQKAT